MRIVLNIDGRRLETSFSRIQKRVQESHLQGMKEGAKTISDYIKSNLLKGQMLRDTSDYLEDRSERTSSLLPGELRKAIRVPAVRIDADTVRLTVSVAGSEKVKQVAQWLQEGRTGPWHIVPVSRKWLHFTWHRGPNEGLKSFALAVDHPGYGEHPFIQQALENKGEYVKNLVARYVRKGL